MTSIWTFSDIHQEHAENAFDPQAAAPAHADVVVCAGDVHIPLSSSIDWLADRLPGVTIVLVPGNHEHWRRTSDDRYSYQDVIAAGRERAASRGITLLVDGDSHEVGNTRFVGGTLWTDFACRPAWSTLSAAMAEASKRMVDYRKIRFGGNRSRDRLDPRDVLALHRATRARIEGVLAEPWDGSTVVVTHHAPSPRSLPEAVETFDVPQAYASCMDGLIERADLWIHGHLHGRADYCVGDTRVLMNARGHVDEPSAKDFDPALVIEVGVPALVPGGMQ